MTKLKFIINLLLLAILAVACQSSHTQAKVAKINLGTEPTTLDPQKARDIYSITLIKMFFEGLTRVGPSDQAELALAKGVDISSDLKTYTFHLRTSSWSNGDPVTANDFITAWKKALEPGFPAPCVSQLYPLKNAQAIREGKLPLSELGVRAQDDLTLVIELEYPIPYFLEMVSQPMFFPVSAKQNAKNPEWALNVSTYVSNGPFKLKTWRHHDLIEVVKNETYWDAAAVKLDGIQLLMISEDAELQMFEKGAIHLAGSPLSALPTDALNTLKGNKAFHSKPFLGTAFLRTNIEKAPFNHPLIRQAFALAIQREALIQHVLQGNQQPATGLVPTSFHLQKQPFFEERDRHKAKELFNQALNELGLKADQLPSITLTFAASDRNHRVTQALQDQWREQLGVQVNLEPLEIKVLFDRVSHQDYQLSLGSWIADFNDPVNFLEIFKYKSNSTNNTQWEDQEFSNLIGESYRSLDFNERFEILAKCEKILMAAMPIIPIYHNSMLYMQKDELKGLIISSLGNLDFKYAYLDNPN